MEALKSFSRRSMLAGASAGLLAPFSRAGASDAMAAVDPTAIQPVNSFAHFAYGVDGSTSWETSFVFLNMDAVATTVQLLTYGPGGSPIVVTVVGGTADSRHTFTVPAGGAIQVDLDKTASSGITIGWVGVVSDGNVRGQGTFRTRVAGGLDLEAVVPMVSRSQLACLIPLQSKPSAMLAMPFDNTSGFVTSVAFANTAIAEKTLDLEFLNQNGAQIYLAHESMAPHVQLAFGTSDHYAPVAGQKGWMRVLNNASDFTALGFRFNPSGVFTTLLPIIS